MRREIQILALLRHIGGDAGLVPVDGAAMLRERPAVNKRAGLELELGGGHFQPDPLLRGGQVPDPEPLGVPSVPQSITFSPQYARCDQPFLVCHCSINYGRIDESI